jgi:hypothetical protein
VPETREQRARSQQHAEHRRRASKHHGRLPERSPIAAFVVDVRGSLALTWHETLDDAMTSLRWDLGDRLATWGAGDERVLVWREVGLMDADAERRHYVAEVRPVG